MTVYLGTYVGRAPPICKSKKVIDETKKCEEIFLANFLRGNSCHPLPILTVITKSHFWKQIKGKRVALKSNKTCWKKSNMKNSSALVRTELVVMGDNSCLRGPGFKSQRNLLDVHDIFPHWCVVKIVLFVWKDRKWTKNLSLGLVVMRLESFGCKILYFTRSSGQSKLNTLRL